MRTGAASVNTRLGDGHQDVIRTKAFPRSIVNTLHQGREPFAAKLWIEPRLAQVAYLVERMVQLEVYDRIVPPLYWSSTLLRVFGGPNA